MPSSRRVSTRSSQVPPVLLLECGRSPYDSRKDSTTAARGCTAGRSSTGSRRRTTSCRPTTLRGIFLRRRGVSWRQNIMSALCRLGVLRRRRGRPADPLAAAGPTRLARRHPIRGDESGLTSCASFAKAANMRLARSRGIKPLSCPGRRYSFTRRHHHHRRAELRTLPARDERSTDRGELIRSRPRYGVEKRPGALYATLGNGRWRRRLVTTSIQACPYPTSAVMRVADPERRPKIPVHQVFPAAGRLPLEPYSRPLDVGPER